MVIIFSDINEEKDICLVNTIGADYYINIFLLCHTMHKNKPEK